jgi:hypothetical protein
MVRRGEESTGPRLSLFYRLFAFAMRPIMRLWHLRLLDLCSDVPRAHDAASADAVGEDRDHVLLVGSSIVAGFGVATHKLGLIGCLSRQLSKTTGRGVAVQSCAGVGVTLNQMVRRLKARMPANLDAVMVLLGADDAVRLTPVPAWKEDLSELIDLIKDVSGDPEISIVVVGVPPFGVCDIGARIPRRLVSVHRRSLNTHANRVCDRHHTVTFVDFPHLSYDDFDPFQEASESYRYWSRRLSVPLATALGHVPQVDVTPRARGTIASTVTCPKCGGRVQILSNPFYGTGLAVHRKLIDCTICGAITLITKSDSIAIENGNGEPDGEIAASGGQRLGSR